MKKSAELIKKRAELIAAQRKLHDDATADSRAELNETETASFRSLQQEIEDLAPQIKDAEDFEENQRLAGTAPESRSRLKNDGKTPEQREQDTMKERYSLHKAIRSQMNGGTGLDGVEKEFHEEALKRAAGLGITVGGVAIPMFDKRADGQTVTQDGGNHGAELVATETRNPIEFLRPKPVLATLGATYLTGLTGDLKFPVNEGGIAASWEGEVDTVSNTKNTYGSKKMSPKRLAASVLISLQNIMQSGIDLEMYTVNEINSIVANAIDAAGINGSGLSGVPEGILNTTGINVIEAGANGALPNWKQIVDMETKVSIENANAARMSYLINPGTKGRLKTTKHEAGDLGYLMATDNTVNGYGVGVSTLVPNNLSKGSGTNLSAGIYGDFSQLYIGQWGFADLSVDNISKKKDGYIEITVNSFIDLMVRQAKAFSVVKDWITV
ncbi:MAG: hypothetical protein BM557_09570 [Flavobacterium sp. MedPE-SWcel]|uniref:phage major capsid protein n=1 Tax=uncultured Flavobacterium sp. TaxID=165435 RepID=UPI0009150517|nr:phage major capsid protein [uncultured Flavobacterium sp.]OIQ16553.1 MAG: hypothetical protein BM557_09570 [Flavobacterium sp. MedPE-SWcel]